MPFSSTQPQRLKIKLNAFTSILSRLFKSLISLLFSPMDDLFNFNTTTNDNDDDDDLFAVDSAAVSGVADDDFLFPLNRRRRLSPSPSSPSAVALRNDRLFLVPYRWWKDASEECEGGKVKGAVYAASSEDVGKECGSSTQIVLELKKQTSDDEDEGVCSKREYALISESMWFTALKWHSDCCTTIKDIGCSLAAEDNNQDLFSIHIRLSMMRHTGSLMVKIREMDNPPMLYGKACQIFDLQFDMLRIWDFSGQVTQFFDGNTTVISSHCLGHADKENLLELQVYGLPPDFGKNLDVSSENSLKERSSNQVPFAGCSNMMNGCVEHESSTSPFLSSQSCARGNWETDLLGLTGLLNLGNTCFMNSAIQCLAHTPMLVNYFLGDFKKQINFENPLGMNGELALVFGDLLRKLWLPKGMSVAPRLFKSTLESFAPQFSGYNQHDSQEFLAFLLDGLHEDLNRVKHKPYREIRDAEGCPDDKVADEYWQNHLARNDSIIVDLFHGQYRSTLVCPICKRVSVTFDPFMYLSLPLPSTTMRSMTVTMLSNDGSTQTSALTVTVPKYGRCKDLINALSVACSLRNDETLLVAEVFNGCILRFLEDPSDSLELIRDRDCLVGYRVPKEIESSRLVVFMHEKTERTLIGGVKKSRRNLFGIPLVTRVSNLSNGSQIYNEYLKLLQPFRNMDDADDHDGIINSENEVANMDVVSTSNSDDSLSSDDETGVSSQSRSYFRCHLTHEQGILREGRIRFNKPLHISADTKELNVCVSWSKQMLRGYDIKNLSLLHEVFNPGLLANRPQELVSLDRCLEGFLKEEPLGPEDMWYCPSCKQHTQASKKLDLWRLPEILVIQLKRFSYSRFLRNKLDTYVDFPVEELNLSGFLAHENGSSSNRYRLYAVSNHYGGMGGGHYTALINHYNRWYEFNDSLVEPVGVDDVKTSAAYVLFYHKIHDT